MGPGLERALTIRANTYNRRSWPRPGPRGESVYLFGTVWYVDETTKEEWYEDWCFRVPLRTPGDLKRTNVEECGILTYDSSKDPSR